LKITLNISKLVEEGKLTRAEAEKLTALAAHDTGSLGINVLIGFGMLAIAAGAVALVPTPLTAVGLGLALFAAGCVIVLNRLEQWILLGQICLVTGALMFGGGVVAYGDGSLASMLIVTSAFGLAAVAARSSLLMVLAVLAASACLGARRGYSHAVYSLAIRANADRRTVFRAGAGRLSGLAAPAGRLRAAGDYRCSHLAATDQFRLLDRLALGRPADVDALDEYQGRIDRVHDGDGHPGRGIQHRLGCSSARCGDLGGAG